MTGVNTYRSAGQVWAGAAMTIAFGFIALASVIYAPSTGGKVVWAVFGLCVCAVSIRLALAGVSVDAAGVRVRNLFNDFTLNWEEIEKFDVGRSGVLGAVCRIHTTDGRTLRAFGIQESHVAAIGSRHPASELAKALNEELRAAHEREGPRSPAGP
jgi:Bacterial PH domain